jgi:hypothetical protein
LESKRGCKQGPEKEKGMKLRRRDKTLLRLLQSAEGRCLACFNHEDGGSAFLQNNGKLLSNYKVSHPRRQKFTNEIYSIKSHQNVN